ncbi:MAG: hypothetical protein D3904_03060 [Candidatus Electrothrix sp. EH2]|nr:hypothetical protein [Candidatus Electrothrix sp. EH2]
MIQKPESNQLRLLDAGAGTGILTVSAALQCLNFGAGTVDAVLYELDSKAVPSLDNNGSVNNF